MIVSGVVRALSLLVLPWLMIVSGANRYVLASMVAGSVVLTTLFSVARFSLVPLAVPFGALLKTNAALTLCSAVATLSAVYAVVVSGPGLAPPLALKICCVISLISAVVTKTIAVPGRKSSHLRNSSGAFRALFDYLKYHRGARELFQMLVLLSFVFVFWNVLLLYLILEDYQPGGVDLHPLFTFAFAGSAIGALIAPQANRVSRPLTIICATVTGVFLASLICVSATRLTTVKYALGIAGVNSGLAVCVIDTILQRVTPSRFRASIAGLRDAIVAALVLLLIVAVESNLERVALVNIFRVLGSVHILTGVALFFLWSRYCRFVFRLFGWPLFARYFQP